MDKREQTVTAIKRQVDILRKADKSVKPILTANAKESRTNMDTYIWGPNLWTVLNDCVFGIETDVTATPYKLYLIELCLRLCPCALCVALSKQIADMIRDGQLGFDPKIILWITHNAVNKKLHKPLVRYDKIVKRYTASSFRKCSLIFTGFYMRLFDVLSVLIYYHDTSIIDPILSCIARIVSNPRESMLLLTAARSTTLGDLEHAFGKIVPGITADMQLIGENSTAAKLNDIDVILTGTAPNVASFVFDNNISV